MNFGALLKQNWLVLLLACATAATLLFISESAYWRAARSLDKLGSIAQARAHLHSLERSLLNAETGQRGYLLTGRPEYLRPYQRALQHVPEALDALDLHYRGEPARQTQMGQLRALSDSKLSELALTIQLHDQGRQQASTEIVLSGIGRDQMEALRVLGAELLGQETMAVESGRDDIYRVLLASRVGVAAVGLTGLLALFLYVRQSAALQLHQRQLKQEVKAERDRLEVEVANRTAELTELTHHLQTAREDERARLARDLHDELGALLTSAKLDAARIKARLATLAPELPQALDVQARLTHLVETLNSGISLKRSIIENLRPSALAHLGLGPTLDILAHEFAEQSGLQVHCEWEPVPLEPDAQLVVYRLVQEALTNISKHAQASQVWITMRRVVLEGPVGQPGEVSTPALGVAAHAGLAVAEEVEVVVRDNGVGFDSTARPASAYGLVGMRFRVQAEGGRLAIVSTAGQGAQVQMRLPVHAQPLQAS
jgi:signal transduction histidine kinase